MARILQIGTINIAVASAKSAAARFAELGLPSLEEELVRLPGRPAQINFLSVPVGESSLSFVEASDPTSPIAKFIERTGEGVFSICLLTDDLKELTAAWRAAGVEWVLDEPMRFAANPRKPAGGLVNWVRPSSLNGLLLEIIEVSA